MIPACGNNARSLFQRRLSAPLVAHSLDIMWSSTGFVASSRRWTVGKRLKQSSWRSCFPALVHLVPKNSRYTHVARKVIRGAFLYCVCPPNKPSNLLDLGKFAISSVFSAVSPPSPTRHPDQARTQGGVWMELFVRSDPLMDPLKPMSPPC